MRDRRRRTGGTRMRLLRDPRVRRAFLIAVSASLVFLIAMGNLVAVAEGVPTARPDRVSARSWSAGAGVEAGSGQERFAFQVDPQGRRVVEFGLTVPYKIQVAHAEGTTQLFGNLRVWVDGEPVVVATRHTVATEERAGTEWEETGDLGPRLDKIIVERAPDSAPFPVLVTWDWHYQGNGGATAYTGRVGPVDLQIVALGGIPGCADPTCARILVIIALVAQGAAVVWLLRARDRVLSATPAKPTGEPTAEPTDKKK